MLDLFSGIGGFSLGLERAGFETVAFCEIDKDCQDVLRKHWPNTVLFENIKNLNGSMVNRVDIICGGFPCQDISVAGNKKGITTETRSGLWREYARIIREVKPKYVIIENVKNLLNIGMEQVLTDLYEAGYDAEWRNISPREINMPHKRDRIWIAAYASGQRCDVLEDISKKRTVFHNVDSHIEAKKDREWPELELRSWKDACLRPRLSTEFWSSKSGIPRVVNGLSKEMDRSNNKRIKQLGNSIVPVIAEIIGRSIMERENGL